MVDDRSVRDARDEYLAENGFTVEAYDDRWTGGSFLGIPLKVPNTAKHRWAIMLHDLHHVATGYGTDMVGEGEISVWEMRHGLRALGPYVGGIVVSGALLGVLAAPRRMLAAWRAARDARSLYVDVDRDHASYEGLLDLGVEQLRTRLGVPPGGLAVEPRGLHTYAPSKRTASRRAKGRLVGRGATASRCTRA